MGTTEVCHCSSSDPGVGTRTEDGIGNKVNHRGQSEFGAPLILLKGPALSVQWCQYHKNGRGMTYSTDKW